MICVTVQVWMAAAKGHRAVGGVDPRRRHHPAADDASTAGVLDGRERVLQPGAPRPATAQALARVSYKLTTVVNNTVLMC